MGRAPPPLPRALHPGLELGDVIAEDELASGIVRPCRDRPSLRLHPGQDVLEPRKRRLGDDDGPTAHPPATDFLEEPVDLPLVALPAAALDRRIPVQQAVE